MTKQQIDFLAISFVTVLYISIALVGAGFFIMHPNMGDKKLVTEIPTKLAPLLESTPTKVVILPTAFPTPRLKEWKPSVATVMLVVPTATKTAKVADGKAIAVSDNEFKEVVLNSAKPVMVVFYASWCPYCLELIPICDELATEHAHELMVVTILTDTNERWADLYEIKGVPTILFIKNRQVVDTVMGSLPKSELEQHIEAVLEKS